MNAIVRLTQELISSLFSQEDTVRPLMKRNHALHLTIVLIISLVALFSSHWPMVSAAPSPQTGFDCDTVVGISVAECQALVALYNSTDGPNWVDNTDWLQTNMPCTWFGVTCTGNTVTSLVLSRNQLSGSFPEEMNSLTNLKYFNLSVNNLHGDIPDWLGNFGQLRQISLSENNLTGTIPSALGSLSNLTQLMLHFNDLSGIIPPALGGLRNLKDLRLNANRLHGDVPLSFKNFVDLEYCDLRYNLLHQTVDEELRVILTNKCEGWYSTQTVRPTNVQTSTVTPNSVTLTWTSINYTANGGGYQILFSTSQGGPYQKLDETVGKTIDNYRVTGLTPNTTYYFVVRTHTPPVPTKTRLDLESAWTPEVSVMTIPDLCMDVTEITSVECNALIAFYGSTDGSNWDKNEGWLQTNTPCSWFGVTCSGDHVIYLQLPNNNLNGSLPAELGHLSDLKSLDLEENALTGTIPIELGNLTKLEFLNIHTTSLTGPIPKSLGNLTNLHTLRLYSSPLTGKIPSELQNLTKLTQLWLFGTQMTGTIPSGIGKLVNLTNLRLDGNFLQGNSQGETNLTELCELTELVDLWLNDNPNLSGSLPSCLIKLTKIEKFYFNNTDLCVPTELETWIANIPDAQSSHKTCEFCTANNVTEIPIDECKVLEELYNSTGGPNWTDNTGWLQTNTPCSWFGVNCNGDHVFRLTLHGNQLRGEIPRQLGDLQKLNVLYLYNNSLTGEIPPELGNLRDLSALSLKTNQLSGKIPTELSTLINLTQLGLSQNELTGEIPPSLGDLRKLRGLQLHKNQLTGSIPVELGDLTALTELHLSDNLLNGSIPSTLGSIPALQKLVLYNNLLSGSIPEELGNLSNLQELQLQSNQLSGSIPEELGNLTNLGILYLNSNLLTGKIPDLNGLTNLIHLSLSSNQLNGGLPENLGILTKLESLTVHSSQLSGPIPLTLENLTELTKFWFQNTDLCISPELDTWIANIPDVQSSGKPCPFQCSDVTEIPITECQALEELYNSTDGSKWTNNTGWLQTNTPCSWFGVTCQANQIRELTLNNNQLSGTLPSQLGDLTELLRLTLSNNQLAGIIPTQLGNLSELKLLSLANNKLTGLIPPQLGNAKKLERLHLATNLLTGPIPPELDQLENLTELTLYFNQLSESIPPQIVTLRALKSLRLFENDLTGEIPSTLGDLENLEELELDNNQLRGMVPPTFGNLKKLKELDLGDNVELTGSLPISLTMIPPQQLSLFINNTDLCIPTDLGAWASQLSDLQPKEYEPCPPPSGLNLTITNIELTQAIQTTGSSERVQMVANRPTIARVTVGVQESDDPVSGVTAHLHASRNGTELTDDSPITPFNAGGTIVAPLSTQRENMAHTLNFLLPDEWLSAGDLTLWAVVNPDGAVQESSNADNRSQDYTHSFHNVPPLPIVVIPVAYQKNGQGEIFTPDLTGSNRMGLGMLQDIYPIPDIDMTLHVTHPFTGDLDSALGWETLLREIGEIRKQEHPTELLYDKYSMPKYYAVLPPEARHYGGLAYEPGTTGMGLSNNVSIAAHKIGHNLGLMHVDCGGPDPESIDKDYPYENGYIGHLGMNIATRQVVADTTRDFMSYCIPEWVSDYHYRRMLGVLSESARQHQVRASAHVAQDALLVSGFVADNGTSGSLDHALPVTTSDVVSEPGNGEYKIALLNSAGAEQVSYLFTPARLDIHEGVRSVQGFSFFVPRIADLAAIRLSKGDMILDTLTASPEPRLSASKPSGIGTPKRTIQWDLQAGPSTTINLRYSPDDGNTWQVVALDVTGNRFELDTTQLPGSNNSIIEVVANDTTAVTRETVAIGAVERKPPRVWIYDGDFMSVRPNQLIVLSGAATDPEDGSLPADSLSWTDPDGTTTNSKSLLIPNGLPAGSYTYFFTATDSDGNRDTATIELAVGQNSVYLPLVRR